MCLHGEGTWGGGGGCWDPPSPYLPPLPQPLMGDHTGNGSFTALVKEGSVD